MINGNPSTDSMQPHGYIGRLRSNGWVKLRRNSPPLMRPNIARNVLYGLYAVPSLLSHVFASEIQQRDLITTTLYETVFEGNSVTHVVQCDASSLLPICNQITWGAMSTAASPTSSSPAPSSSFVLRGSGAYEDYYFEFNGGNNRVLLGTLGQHTLVALQLEDTALKNAGDNSQIVYLRYNTTIAQRFAIAGESDYVVSLIREVRYGVNADITEADYADGWFWDTTINQPGLVHQDIVWKFFAEKPAPNSARDIDLEDYGTQGDSEASNIKYKRQDVEIYIYMLPDTITIPANSSLQQVNMVADQPQQFSAFFSTPQSTGGPKTPTLSPPNPSSSPITTPSPSSPVTSPPTTPPTLSPPSSPATSPNTSPPTSSPPSSPPTTPPTTPPPSTPSTPMSPPLSTDAYDVIMQDALQDFCTTLLGYFSPMETLPSTVYSHTSTDIIWSTTTTSTILDVPFTYTTFTSTSSFPDVHQKREISTPTQLSTFAATALQSGCSRAIVSPTATATTYSLTSTLLVKSISTTFVSILVSSSTKTVTQTAHTTFGYYGLGQWTFTPVPADQAASYDGYSWAFDRSPVDNGGTSSNLLIHNTNLGANFAIYHAGAVWNMHIANELEDWLLCINPSPDSTSLADHITEFYRVSDYTNYNVVPVAFIYDDLGTHVAQLDNDVTYVGTPMFFFWCTDPITLISAMYIADEDFAFTGPGTDHCSLAESGVQLI
ncbi:hypothetical protein AA313_de0209366 [Arthrobotrys entomopaga]|nr:hypothetical protein AA313_de0209366 [Arthrobotrys entomopaga]